MCSSLRTSPSQHTHTHIHTHTHTHTHTHNLILSTLSTLSTSKLFAFKATAVLDAQSSANKADRRASTLPDPSGVSVVGADPRELVHLRERVEELSAALEEKHAELTEQEAAMTSLKHELDQVVSGVTGLADARKRIKDLERAHAIVDGKLVDMTDKANKLSADNFDLLDKLDALRDRLGMAPDESVSTVETRCVPMPSSIHSRTHARTHGAPVLS
jgi:chromosome segregation ATPase